MLHQKSVVKNEVETFNVDKKVSADPGPALVNIAPADPVDRERLALALADHGKVISDAKAHRIELANLQGQIKELNTEIISIQLLLKNFDLANDSIAIEDIKDFASQLLGMLLTAPQKLADAHLIDPEDLSCPDYRVMLDALRDLSLARNGLTEDNRPDVIEMVAARTRRPEKEIAMLVVALIEDCFSTANIADFAAKTKRASLDRRIDDAMKGGDRRAVHDLVAEQDRIKERLKKPAPKSRFVWADEFCALPPTEIWSIEDYFEPDTLCVMYGDSEAYKSFLAIDIACHIAIGKAWRGHEVKQGIALYIAGEGGNGLRKRIKAWFEYYGEPIRNIAVSTVPRYTLSLARLN